ncbi:MAG: hypothetical protein GY729_19380, partial [Desulfobacteraceae bacterium]|nr:hypothetical protein [Desulfobacteraceae bacterium]
FDQATLNISGTSPVTSSGFTAGIEGASTGVNGAFFGSNADAIGGNFDGIKNDTRYTGIFGGNLK